jgi:hypothetical protein
MTGRILTVVTSFVVITACLQNTVEARHRRHRCACRHGAAAPCYTPCMQSASAAASYKAAPQSRGTLRLLRTSPEELATLILEDPAISLATTHVSGTVDQATARLNMEQTSRGEQAVRSSYGGAPGGTVQLQASMLAGLSALSQTHGYRMSISEVAGGSHSANSRHYVGVAFDVNSINGTAVSSTHPQLRQFMQHCRDLGATEVLGPGSAGHATHVHAAWPRP